MAFLRPCGRLIRGFVKIPTTCQLILTQRILVNKISKGYVNSLSSRNIYLSTNNKQLHNSTKNKNVLLKNELEIYLETLSIGYNNMNVEYEDLLNTLKLYSSANDDDDDFDDKTAIFLLNCCGKVLCNVQQDQRQNLTHHVWNLLQKKISNLTLEHYHTLLSIYSQNNEIIKANEFIQSMKVEPNEKTFLHLLNIAGKTGDLDVATFSLTKMKELDYPLSQESLNYLIETYWRRGDIDLAVSTLETLISAGLTPQKELYANLACGYAAMEMTDEVLKMIKNHSFDGKQMLRIIKYLNHTTDEKKIEEIYKYLPTEEIVSDPILINTLAELVHIDKIKEAENIVKYFLNNEQPSKTIQLVEQFLSSLVLSKQSPTKILNITKYFETIYNSKMLLLKLLEASLKSSQREISIEILEKMKMNKIEIRTHYYWPLFVQASKEGEISIISTIRHMLNLEVPMDHITLMEFILPYISTSDPLITLKKLNELGLKLSQVLTSLACYNLEQGKITETIKFLTSTKAKLDFNKITDSLIKCFQICNDVDGCAKILQFSPKGKNYAGIFLHTISIKKTNVHDLSILDKIITSFENHKIFISSDTIKSITDAFSSSTKYKDNFNIIMRLNNIENVNLKQSNSERLSGIPHPRDMTLEGLECHLIELKSKKLNTRGVLRKLLIGHCKKGNLNRVEELKDEIEKSDMTMSPAMKAHLFDIYAKNGKVSEVCSLLLDLQKNHPNFIIDSFKLVQAATALVKHNKIDIALELINKNDNSLHKVPSDCWGLLDEIARSEHNDMTHVFLDTLIKKGFCDINNTVLGPLVRRHLIRNDLVSAVETFSIISNEYNMTPLKQELIGALIDSELLKTVTEIVARIHGQETVDMEVIIAYAKHGMINELKKSLNNLVQLNIPWENTTKNIPDDVKEKILINILDASSGIERINRLPIYELLLDIYCKTGNCQEILKMWNKMKSEDVIPSLTFKNNFSSLLSTYNISIPN